MPLINMANHISGKIISSFINCFANSFTCSSYRFTIHYLHTPSPISMITFGHVYLLQFYYHYTAVCGGDRKAFVIPHTGEFYLPVSTVSQSSGELVLEANDMGRRPPSDGLSR